jgi:threonine/homoserine/homoserine lactone efflux protein
MDPGWFPRGLVIGFAIAAPVGPIGVLVIRRTLLEGRLAGFISGAGAATADAFYGSLAAFGLTALAGILVSHSAWIRLIGGLFLCYLGLTTLRARPQERAASSSSQGLARAYASTVFLTITNPATIISFGAIFAGLGLVGNRAGYASAGLLVLGVFSGSLLWWFILSGCLSLFRQRFSTVGLRWVNVISGVTIMLFGLAALLSVVRSILPPLAS